MTVEKTMTLGEVLSANPQTARIFMEFGMHCLGCPHSIGESIEEASVVHGVNCDELVHQLNEFLSEQGAQ